MEWLNYHHLLYFYTVVREGGVGQAAKRLSLTQPTLSSQIKSLEGALGEKLFQKAGRLLEPTEAGRVVYRYAEEIFGLGQELRDTLKGRPTGKRPELRVGVTNVVPKAIAHSLLAPVIDQFKDIRLLCSENELDALLEEMAAHRLDLVISDAPLPENSVIKAFSHSLGECDMTFMAASPLAQLVRKGFPASLRNAPMLLPGRQSSMRRALDTWLESQDIRPHIRGEFEDTALLKVFGDEGHGVWVVPTPVAKVENHSQGLKILARVSELRVGFYAISPERRIKNPAVQYLLNAAREGLLQAVTKPLPVALKHKRSLRPTKSGRGKARSA